MSDYRHRLENLLSTLTAREEFVIERRLINDTLTLQAIGDILGIRRERVRQIEARALQKLRRRERLKYLSDEITFDQLNQILVAPGRREA